MEVIRIEKDNERAKSLLALCMMRHGKLDSFDVEKESSLVVESYYEIIKELITAILFADGYKTLSHKDLIEYLKVNYNDKFTEHETEAIDILRKRRNKIVYYGIFTDSGYVKRNRNLFERIIEKLRNIIEYKLQIERI